MGTTRRRGLEMLLEAGPRNGYRRLGNVSAQIDRLALHQWHVTITVLHPGGWVLDETVPIIDLGTFGNTEDARDAADLILENWNWT